MLARWRAGYEAAASGWVLAVGACLSIGLVDGMAFWAFALFVAPLEAEFGWSGADVSAGVSLTLLLQGAASVLVGHLVDRHGPRRIMLVGTVGVGAAYLGLTLVAALWHFYVLLGVLAFFQGWVLYVPCTTLVTRWFSHHRTTALSIVMSGFNVGGLLVLPILTELLEATGWRTSFATVAVLVLALNGALIAVMRDNPPPSWTEREARGYDGADRREPSLLAPADGPVFATPHFWLLAVGFACFYFSFLGFLYHGPHLLEDAGVPARYAALLFSCAAGTGLLIRLTSGGWLGRYERHEIVAAAAMLVMVVGLLALLTGPSLPALTAFALLWGIGSGIAPTLEPVLAGRLFGRARYASVYGALDSVGIVVSIPGPWLVGILAETSGGYAAVAALYGGVLLLAAASFALLAHLLPRRGLNDAPTTPARGTPRDAHAEVNARPEGAAADDGELVTALVCEGQALARAGERRAAHARLVRATDRDPKCEDAWLWRAATAEDADEGIACLEHLLLLKPGHARALRGLESLHLLERVARLEESGQRRQP